MMNYETPEAQAALKLALMRPVKELSQMEVVDFILLSNKSFWYHQAVNWAATPPEACKDEFTKAQWCTACWIIKETVEWGYNKDSGKWWDRQATLPRDELLAEILVLSDFGIMLENYRNNSMDIISRGFEVFIEIMNGKDWKKKFLKYTKKLEQKS